MIPSGWELVLLIGVLFLLFGATKLPTAARSLGQSLRIFKAETRSLRSGDSEDADIAPGASRPATQQPASPQPATQQPPPQRDHDTAR